MSLRHALLPPHKGEGEEATARNDDGKARRNQPPPIFSLGLDPRVHTMRAQKMDARIKSGQKEGGFGSARPPETLILSLSKDEGSNTAPAAHPSTGSG